MKGQALRPDYMLKSIPEIEPVKIEELTDEERNYKSMSLTTGWEQFVKLKEEALESMEEKNKEAVKNGLSWEQIGQNTVVINMVTEIVEKLFNKVLDAAEACDNARSK